MSFAIAGLGLQERLALKATLLFLVCRLSEAIFSCHLFVCIMRFVVLCFCF